MYVCTCIWNISIRIHSIWILVVVIAALFAFSFCLKKQLNSALCFLFILILHKLFIDKYLEILIFLVAANYRLIFHAFLDPTNSKIGCCHFGFCSFWWTFWCDRTEVLSFTSLKNMFECVSHTYLQYILLFNDSVTYS